MDSMASATTDRLRQSSPSEQLDLVRRPHEVSHSHGDTYVSGSANVQFGDRIYIDNTENSLKQEIRRIQDSLAFSHMHERYESLQEAADGTYQWILEPDPGEGQAGRQHQIAPFFNWLQNGSGVFWISGKPGSGKSTLMKYLVENVSEPTENTSPHSAVFSFFFWIGGTNLQRNKIGCMRSLLWQALQMPSTQDMAGDVCRFHYKGAWTERVLRATLSAYLASIASPTVIFLDGLDESKDHDEILDLLDIFPSTPQVKLCISSRPETTLTHSLESFPSLRLQNLNSKDIKHVIQTMFIDDPRVRGLAARSGSNIHQNDVLGLGRQIEYKAEGVFLWVVLVIKDLLKGITQRDDLMTLSKRLDRLPGDINLLYQDLLQRAQPDSELYKNEAVLYLSLALHRDFDLFGFCFAINENLRKEYLHASVFDRSVRPRVPIDHIRVKTWISTRTAGLLEVRADLNGDCQDVIMGPAESERLSQLEEAAVFAGNFSVRFIHRTAYDYLQNTAQGRSLLNSSLIASTTIEQICFEVKLIMFAGFPALMSGHMSVDVAKYILLDCTKCSYGTIYDCLKSKGQYMMDLLCSAGLLLVDANNWMVSLRELTWGDDIRFFPSSKYATVDLLPVLISSRRYTTASMWLNDYDCMGDSAYLTMLLICVLYSTRYGEQNPPGLFELLGTLLDGGGDLYQMIETPIGEVFHPLGAALLQLCWAGIGSTPCAKSLCRRLQVSDSDLSIKIWPSCVDCHGMLHRRGTYEAEYEFWGFFSAAGCKEVSNTTVPMTKNLQLSSPEAPGSDRIYVIASMQYSSHPLEIPNQLWAISERSSKELSVSIRGLAAQAGIKTNIVVAPGIHRVIFWRDVTGAIKPDKLLRSSVERICASSPRITFATAMKRLEKSQETIQKFYECEAKRMAYKSEDVQKRWKEWYWGDDSPAVLDETST